jgi:hypothetical protein
MKRLSLGLALLVGLSMFTTTPASAETVLQDQLLTSNLNLDFTKSPYRIEGLIQVPKGLTLTIGPGVKVTFGINGGIKTLGDVFIGAASPNAITEIISSSGLRELIGNGLIPPSITIVNTKIVGNGSSLVYGCRNLSIQNSHISNFYQIVSEQECEQLSIKNSLLTKVNSIYDCFFDGHPSLFELSENIIDGMNSTSCSDDSRRTMTNYGRGSFKIERNDFRNLTNVNLPYGFQVFSIKGNNFGNVKQVKFFSNYGGVINSDLTNNYWGAFSDEVTFRNEIKVIDAKTDIALSEVLTLFPIKSSPTLVAGAAKELLEKSLADNLASEVAAKAAAELKAKQEAEAKAAAELKAKQEAEAKAAVVKAAADKAAAELKAKQEADAKAAADKAALAKAQFELVAANAALADAQKVNRELQTQLNSVEAQFKLLSDSVSVIQGQVSQLNSKLAAALAGQNAANAKLKKVCSAKPKPKGC